MTFVHCTVHDVEQEGEHGTPCWVGGCDTVAGPLPRRFYKDETQGWVRGVCVTDLLTDERGTA